MRFPGKTNPRDRAQPPTAGPADRRRSVRPARLALTLAACCLIAVVIIPRFQRTLSADTLESARASYRAGQYEKAIAIFEEHAKAPGQTQKEARLGLLATLLKTGDYERTEALAREYMGTGGVPEIQVALGKVLALTGKTSEAKSAFQAGLQAPGTAGLEARFGLGSLLARTGDWQHASEMFTDLFDRASQSNERHMAALAAQKLERFQEANDLFREATTQDPKNAEAWADWGQLFLEKYDKVNAASVFEDGLKANPNHPEALVGLAAASEDEPVKSEVLIKKALAVNPRLETAHLLLARMAIEEEKYPDAAEEIRTVLQVNPQSLEALSLRAVLHLAQWDQAGVEKEIGGLLSLNPSWGEVYEELGNFAVTQRLYRQSVDYFRKAVELNPRLWTAYSTLGINLLRLGDEAAARDALETSYKNDAFNVWTVNTLRLIDSYENFREVKKGRFRIKLHKKEADVLEQYAPGLLEEVAQTLGNRYSYQPTGTIYLEMYPDHEDFAVRTLGLPGLGALGVCFGSGMVMDSPTARPKGTFNWGSTLWHEFAHVITLGMTDHRIPRWFSEGLSVMEEHRARPGWGDAVTLDIVKLMQEKKILPIGELNGAFSRPRFPGQVQFAYFQAGQVCEFIEKEFGFPKILAMLSLYKSGQSLDQVLNGALGVSPEAFDKRFASYLDQQFGPTIRSVDAKLLPQEELLKDESGLRGWLAANPNDFFGTLHLAKLLVEQGKKQEAIPLLQKAKQLFPGYDAPDNPYRALADIHKEAGQLDKAIAELQELRSQSANNFDSMKKLGLWLKEAGRADDSASALTDALYVYPFDVETHQVLAGLASGKNNHEIALREYRVLLALDSTDKAGIHFNIAKTLAQLGRSQEAKREVLAALEIAPEFEAAQELLLELSKN